jgi:hypothetical protein
MLGTEVVEKNDMYSYGQYNSSVCLAFFDKQELSHHVFISQLVYSVIDDEWFSEYTQILPNIQHWLPEHT